MADVKQLQQQFVAEVARRTGVDPAVVDQWVGREGAYAPNGTGGLNFLNLRPYKSDTGVVSHSSGGFDQFASLPDAVDSTVTRIKQPFLQQYLAPALGKGPDAQWNAIAASGWDAGHYGHAPLPASGPSSSPAAQQEQPADDTAQRQSLLAFLQGNVQHHAHPDPGAFLQELVQLKGLGAQPFPAAQPTVPMTVPEKPPGVVTPSGGSVSLANVPAQIATRDGIQIDKAIIAPVSRIAESFGVKVNSGYRDAQHNTDVGGAPHSDHLNGDAVDFTGTPDQMAELYQWAQGRFPYVEPMSEAHDHVHISFIRGGQ